MSAFERPRFIVAPNRNDVLFSNGLQPEHCGSQRFREMCQMHSRNEYFSKNMSYQESSHIVAYWIVNGISRLDPPGRFLRHTPLEEAKKKGMVDDFHRLWKFSPQGYDIWEEIDREMALKLVEQVLMGIGPLDQQPPQKSKTEDKIDSPEEFYSLLAMDEAPKFTDEDYRREQESLKEDESADILKDLFGKLGQIGNHHPKKKRARLPTGTTPSRSVSSLLQDMRKEIVCIPQKDKSSLVEAQTKACSSEFSDGRLELFLRREEMDPQRAAQRFVSYWEERQKVFGPKKYLMSMSLDGAMCDDLPVLQSGIFCLLPHRDLSGRYLLFREQARRIPEQHTSESMLRVWWYLLELISIDHEGSCKTPEFVQLCWEKNTTMWDWDRQLLNRMTRLEEMFLPVRRVACHVCCPPLFGVLVIKPIAYANLDKNTRQRTKVHDVPEEQLPEVLAGFGILSDMLPTEMGGTVELSKHEWSCYPFKHASTTDERMNRNSITGSPNDAESTTEQPKELVKQSKDIKVTAVDVICGREKALVNYVGNRHFRDVVAKALPEHSSYNKAQLVNAVIAEINNAGGRFLKQDPVTCNWYVLSNAQAKEKVGYALRDRNNSLKNRENNLTRRKGSQPPSDTGAVTETMMQPLPLEVPSAIQDSGSSSYEQDYLLPESPMSVSAKSTRMAPIPPFLAPPTTGFVAQSLGHPQMPLVEGTQEQGTQSEIGKLPMELLRHSMDIIVTPADVLCGKEKASLNHVGTRRFQDIVSKALPEHSSYNKAQLVNAVAAEINNAGGRFLKQDPVTGNWYALGNAQKREKIGYALRDRNNKLKKKQIAQESQPPSEGSAYSLKNADEKKE